jgi:hypothetical protein
MPRSSTPAVERVLNAFLALSESDQSALLLSARLIIERTRKPGVRLARPVKPVAAAPAAAAPAPVAPAPAAAKPRKPVAAPLNPIPRRRRRRVASPAAPAAVAPVETSVEPPDPLTVLPEENVDDQVDDGYDPDAAGDDIVDG